MPSRSSFNSASNWSRPPCSMNWSGTPRRRTRLVSIPASLAASSTALPKPPGNMPSSTVTTNGALAEGPEDRLAIQGLDEAGVDYGHLDAFAGQHAPPRAIAACSSAPQRQWRRPVPSEALRPCRAPGAPARGRSARPGLGIADRRRAVELQGQLEHRRHVGLVAGRHDRQVRQRPQVGDVEHAVVRGTVGTHAAGAIQRAVSPASSARRLPGRSDRRPAAGTCCKCRRSDGLPPWPFRRRTPRRATRRSPRRGSGRETRRGSVRACCPGTSPR